MPPKAYYFPSIPSNLYTTTEQTAAALVQRAAPAYERTTSLIIFFVFLLSNLNRRLMCSLNEWRQRMKEQLLLQVRGLILHGTPTPGGRHDRATYCQQSLRPRKRADTYMQHTLTRTCRECSPTVGTLCVRRGVSTAG